MSDLATLTAGELQVNLHRGQVRAWNSVARFVVVLAGTQSGKTSFGPHWLLREIQRGGPGDYLVVTPTFPLLELKLLPEFRKLFERWMKLGRYVSGPLRQFRFSDEGAKALFGMGGPSSATRVLFGYAGDPESLESATVKAAWLDEAGQKQFKVGAWEAILRRLSLAMGRVLITTSVYTLGWLKNRLFDRAATSGGQIEVVNFASTANPAFPREEFERARRDLPPWKFKMQYLGEFERPAGVIYDCFGPECVVPRFTIPRDWKRYLGVDFGSQNTAATWWAEEPGTRKLYAYRAYHRGGVSAPAHVRALLHGETQPARCVGGAASEDDWRREFAAAGLAVREPAIRDVEVGIDRVYGAIQRGEVMVFDDLADLRDEFESYSREVDESGNVLEAIEDKNSYHLLDSVRYIVGDLRPGGARQAQGAKRIKEW